WWWKRSILAIAREEMGHLLTVQNVLRLVGGPISLDRSDYPWDTPFYPFDFSLEPLTFDTLCCYLFAELPDPIPDAPERYVLFKTKYVEDVKKAADKHATGGSAKGVHVVYDWILKVI